MPLTAMGLNDDGQATVVEVEAIVVDGGWLMGGTDGRNVGKAAGY